ncbi:uncharacterized protein [Vicugna pacos]|uniref:Collagen alpha-1(I) chain-like n=1 Tax=Vicugna pacos TaxID=30538 RepID=A0ABM5EFB2_VICPA
MPRELHDTRWAKQQQAGRKGEFCGSISEERRGRKGKGRAARAPSTPGREAQSQQVSAARHRGTLFALAALTSVSERAPGAGRLARGPGGERRRGQRPPWPGRAEAGRGVRTGGSTAARRPDTAPRLGASSCLAAAAASSSQAASAGRLLGLGQHFPAVSHTPLGERGLLHTRTRPQTARSLGKIRNSGRRAQGVAEAKARQRCADLGVPSERQPREGRADAGGARPTQFVRRSPSARRPRWPDWHPSCRPCGLGREPAAAPPHISGLRAEAEQWPLPHDRLKARTGARGSGEVLAQATPRTATEGRCPPTEDPKEFSDHTSLHLSVGSVSKQPGSASVGPKLKRADQDGANHARKMFKSQLSVLCIRIKSNRNFFIITKFLS